MWTSKPTPTCEHRIGGENKAFSLDILIFSYLFIFQCLRELGVESVSLLCSGERLYTHRCNDITVFQTETDHSIIREKRTRQRHFLENHAMARHGKIQSVGRILTQCVWFMFSWENTRIFYLKQHKYRRQLLIFFWPCIILFALHLTNNQKGKIFTHLKDWQPKQFSVTEEGS